jgi:hypothetical protein
MIRNLKKMMDDERGMATIFGCLVEIYSCLWPPTWLLCCLPCWLPIIMVPTYGIMDIIMAPLECLLGGVLGLGCCAIGSMLPLSCCAIVVASPLICFEYCSRLCDILGECLNVVIPC